MTMTQTLLFKDPSDLSDLAAYLTRAKRLDAAAAVKLRCVGNLVAVYVSPIYTGSLMGDGPTVLGLRTSELAANADLDGTFDISAILERLANNPAGSAQLTISSGQVRAPWSGVIPPRDGWEEAGTIAQTQITNWAKEGISEVAIALPVDVGASIASKVRLQIWGRAVDPKLGLPAGAAFAMAGLGFMQPQEEISVFSNQNWLRLSSRHGHVLAKRSSSV